MKELFPEKIIALPIPSRFELCRIDSKCGTLLCCLPPVRSSQEKKKMRKTLLVSKFSRFACECPQNRFWYHRIGGILMQAFSKAVDRLAVYSGAEKGDRTMLDVLYPAAGLRIRSEMNSDRSSSKIINFLTPVIA